MAHDRVGRRLLAALAGSTPAFARPATGGATTRGRRLLAALAGSTKAFADGTAGPLRTQQRPERRPVQVRTRRPDVGVSGSSMISLLNVTKRFGPRPVLRDITFEVPAGQRVALVGPSGAGKSTLCRAINGFEPIDSGVIRIDGRPLPPGGRALADLRADIGMVFPTINLFAHKRILDNITLGPVKVRKQSRAAARDNAMELLEVVGIAVHGGKYPAQLPKEQQQLAAIARALAMEPKALLFDEPTALLDVEAAARVSDVIANIARTWDITMLVVTHDLGFARHIADRLIYLADGQIVEDTTAREFFSEPGFDRARDPLRSDLSD